MVSKSGKNRSFVEDMQKAKLDAATPEDVEFVAQLVRDLRDLRLKEARAKVLSSALMKGDIDSRLIAHFKAAYLNISVDSVASASDVATKLKETLSKASQEAIADGVEKTLSLAAYSACELRIDATLREPGCTKEKLIKAASNEYERLFFRPTAGFDAKHALILKLDVSNLRLNELEKQLEIDRKTRGGLKQQYEELEQGAEQDTIMQQIRELQKKINDAKKEQTSLQNSVQSLSQQVSDSLKIEARDPNLGESATDAFVAVANKAHLVVDAVNRNQELLGLHGGIEAPEQYKVHAFGQYDALYGAVVALQGRMPADVWEAYQRRVGYDVGALSPFDPAHAVVVSNVQLSDSGVVLHCGQSKVNFSLSQLVALHQPFEAQVATLAAEEAKLRQAADADKPAITTSIRALKTRFINDVQSFFNKTDDSFTIQVALINALRQQNALPRASDYVVMRDVTLERDKVVIKHAGQPQSQPQPRQFSFAELQSIINKPLPGSASTPPKPKEAKEMTATDWKNYVDSNKDAVLKVLAQDNAAYLQQLNAHKAAEGIARQAAGQLVHVAQKEQNTSHFRQAMALSQPENAKVQAAAVVRPIDRRTKAQANTVILHRNDDKTVRIERVTDLKAYLAANHIPESPVRNALTVAGVDETVGTSRAEWIDLRKDEHVVVTRNYGVSSQNVPQITRLVQSGGVHRDLTEDAVWKGMSQFEKTEHVIDIAKRALAQHHAKHADQDSNDRPLVIQGGSDDKAAMLRAAIMLINPKQNIVVPNAAVAKPDTLLGVSKDKDFIRTQLGQDDLSVLRVKHGVGADYRKEFRFLREAASAENKPVEGDSYIRRPGKSS